MDTFLIGIYIVLWAVTFFVYQRKRKTFDVGSFILFLYLLTAIASYFLYGDENYGSSFRGLSLFTFLLLFVLLFMGAYPVLKYDGRNKILVAPNQRLIVIISLIFIVSSLLGISSTIQNFRQGLVLLLTTDDGGADLYKEALESNENMGHGGLSHLSAVLITALTNISALFLFYLIKFYKQNKMLVWGLAISFVLLFMQYISMGTRGAVVEFMLLLISSYFLMRPFYSKKITTTVNKALVLLAVLVSIPFIAITVSRFENQSGGSGVGSSTLFYAGQENLYFNKYALDNNGIRYGDRVIPLFKRMVFINNVPHNFWERRAKYPRLIINDEVFVTFAGDFLFDFGPLFGSLVIIFISILFLQITRARGHLIGFHQLIILHMIVIVCSQGAIKLFPLSDVGGNLQIIVYILAYFAFKSSKHNVKLTTTE